MLSYHLSNSSDNSSSGQHMTQIQTSITQINSCNRHMVSDLSYLVK